MRGERQMASNFFRQDNTAQLYAQTRCVGFDSMIRILHHAARLLLVRVLRPQCIGCVQSRINSSSMASEDFTLEAWPLSLLVFLVLFNSPGTLRKTAALPHFIDLTWTVTRTNRGH